MLSTIWHHGIGARRQALGVHVHPPPQNCIVMPSIRILNHYILRCIIGVTYSLVVSYPETLYIVLFTLHLSSYLSSGNTKRCRQLLYSGMVIYTCKRKTSELWSLRLNNYRPLGRRPRPLPWASCLRGGLALMHVKNGKIV